MVRISEPNPPVRATHYNNPVFDSSFPDPFVFKFGNAFYGYSTGLTKAGDLAFPVIRSRDLITWEEMGGAMKMLDTKPPHYWAPEVTYFNGKFYLYYSCGNEVHMEIRVATSDRPEGGFIDSGVRLTNDEFAIDPHVFLDTDGRRYLFYATDFLDHTHIGTGTVADRLLDFFRLEGNPRPVSRARFDWQVYDPHRAEKRNVRWHTVEGPAVIKRKGLYFQMFSGGNWQNESYGVAYAITGEIEGDGEWSQPIDGSTRHPILRSKEGRIQGPGHNSIVIGPNNREHFCVYHSWIDGQRVMSIDRLDLVGDRMILLGPTLTPQLKPFGPRKISFPYESARAKFVIEDISVNFLLRTTIRVEQKDGKIAFDISTSNGSRIASLYIGADEARFRSALGSFSSLPYPDDTTISEFQDLGVESTGGSLLLTLNQMPWFKTCLKIEKGSLQFDVTCTGSRMLSLDLTEGYVDLFEDDAPSGAFGWTNLGTGGVFTFTGKRMQMQKDPLIDESATTAVKGDCFKHFEFVANICSLGSPLKPEPAYGFVFLSDSDSASLWINILYTGAVEIRNTAGEVIEVKPDPPFEPGDLRQFRFVKMGESLEIDSEGFSIAAIKVGSQRGRIGIVSYGCEVSLEMVRSIRIEL